MKHDSAFFDRMYNARELVPDHPDYFRRWAAESVVAMRGGSRSLDVRYGGGPNEHLDVFMTEADRAPVLVFIHGGYWRSLDKKDHGFIAPPFTRQGICTVLPNYALCPDVTIPEIVMQMVKALAWTRRHIAQYGGDPDRIFVAGHSAGGHLAAMMAACAWDAYEPSLPRNLVKGAVSISGLHDLDPIMRTSFLQPSVHLTPEQVRKASPARLPAPPHGKLYSVCGALESDEFHRQAKLMRDAWGEERVPVCEPIPGRDHFSVLEALTEPGNRLHELTLELVQG